MQLNKLWPSLIAFLICMIRLSQDYELNEFHFKVKKKNMPSKANSCLPLMEVSYGFVLAKYMYPSCSVNSAFDGREVPSFD